MSTTSTTWQYLEPHVGSGFKQLFVKGTKFRASQVYSAAYQRGKTGVVVTFDEGEGSQFGEDCATNTTDESCHIPAILISPSVRPGTTSGTLFNHYSLLRTTEQMLGVRRRYLLGEAKRAPSMRRAFRF